MEKAQFLVFLQARSLPWHVLVVKEGMTIVFKLQLCLYPIPDTTVILGTSNSSKLSKYKENVKTENLCLGIVSWYEEEGNRRLRNEKVQKAYINRKYKRHITPVSLLL